METKTGYFCPTLCTNKKFRLKLTSHYKALCFSVTSVLHGDLKSPFTFVTNIDLN